MKKSIVFILVLMTSLISHAQNDLSLDSAFHRSNVGEYYSNGLEYYQMPITQLRPIEFSALVSNNGATDISNCYLQVDMMYSNTVIQSIYSDSVLIQSSTQDSLYCNSVIDLSGQIQGQYEFIVSVYSDSSELNYANNIDTIHFEITDNMLSRSDFEIVDSTKYYYHDSLDYRSFGYVFKVESDACLSAIYPWFTHYIGNSQPSSGGVYASLFKLDSINNEFEYLTMSGIMTQPMNSSELGSPYNIPFSSSAHPYALLEEQNVYLVTVNTPNNLHEFYLSQTTIDSTLYRAFSNLSPGSVFSHNEVVLDGRMIMMDIEFGNATFCNLNLHENRKVEIALFPNPSSGMLTIHSESNSFQNPKISIYSINGFKLKEFELNDGTFMGDISLDITDLDNGAYFLHYEDENNSIIKKIQLLK